MAALAACGCYGASGACPISGSTIMTQPLCFELGNPRAASFLPCSLPCLLLAAPTAVFPIIMSFLVVLKTLLSVMVLTTNYNII